MDLAAAARTVVRLVLAAILLLAGVGHFTNHEEFLAQTPSFLPARSLIVWGSGVVEIGLGLALVAWRQRRRMVGLAVAAFFVLIFPGNVYQALAGHDAFGLDSDAARLVRLAFQPVLVLAALWSTRAWPPWGIATPRSGYPTGHGPA